jgi:hypothetical protein
MSDVRYVCLSDLHLGAQNSILTGLQPGTVHVDPDRASPVLESLRALLQKVVSANEDQTRKPTLVLNGDLLELALASDDVALRMFDVFLDQLFPATGESLFDREVWYLPGNHDHHMWEATRERQFADFLCRHPDRVIPLPWHSTWLYPKDNEPSTTNQLLDTIAQRKKRDLRFVVAYPNLGIRAADNSTAIVFHHGQYTEGIYRAMTTLKSIMFPDQRHQRLEAWDLEAENFAWIDFLWGTLGRSGKVGEDMGIVYDILQSPTDMRKLVDNIASGVADRLPRPLGAGLVKPVVRGALRRLLHLAVGVTADFERRTSKSDGSPLTSASRELLISYLNEQVAGQLRSDHPNQSNGDSELPRQVKFVFGHTHKPFIGSEIIPSFGATPVRIFNTGGWVVDTVKADQRHGANLVLVGDDLEVACVRLYNQSDEPGSYRVRMDDALPDDQGPLYSHLAELIVADPKPWTAFSSAVSAAVTERQGVLATILADPTSPDLVPKRQSGSR